MKKFLRKTLVSVLLGGALLFAMPVVPALAASGTWYTIDMNTTVARVMTAHGAANRTQSLAGIDRTTTLLPQSTALISTPMVALLSLTARLCAMASCCTSAAARLWGLRPTAGC